jgi:hypothetical protein
MQGHAIARYDYSWAIDVADGGHIRIEGNFTLIDPDGISREVTAEKSAR